MKTLVVLSALVCLATAAPTLEGKHTRDLGTIVKNVKEPIKRQKKSPQDTLFNPLPAASVGFNTQQSDVEAEIEFPTASARSFGFKKSPIVVKKHSGYHVYRDSNEERAAGPQVSCAKQLRVKVCDGKETKSADLKRSTDEIHKEDIETSIKIAKEAVESLQRDFETIEDDSKVKNAQWKHGKESDKEMHEDMKLARLAIDEAQKSFGTLESINLHATTLTDTEALHDGMEKSEEQRLAFNQWKEAMKNIQKNVEIARNIEDTFKMAGQSFMPSEAFDTTKMMKSNIQESTGVHKTSGKEAMDVTTHAKHILEEDTSKKSMEKHEMKSAASEKTDNVENLKSTNLNHNRKEKSSELTSDDKTNDIHLKDNKTDIKLDTTLRTSTKEDKTHSHHHEHNHHEHDSTTSTSTRSTDNKPIVSETNEEKSALKTKTLETHNVGVADHHTRDSLIEDLDTDASEHHEHGKSAGEETDGEELSVKAADHDHMAHSSVNHHPLQSSTMNKHEENEHLMKSAEHLSEPKTHLNDIKKSESSLHSNIRLSDNNANLVGQSLFEPVNMKLNHEMNVHLQKMKQEKSAEIPKEMHLEQARHSDMVQNSHHTTHEQMHHHNHHGMDMHHMNTHGFGGHHHLSNMHMGHGKSAEMDFVMAPSTHMSMRESTLEDLMHWNHPGEAARSSYGSSYSLGGSGINSGGAGGLAGGSSSGAGAVGVFPNAKVGGCAIPLLLSCSPSVVHGSLAKSHPGYSAPAYRSEANPNFKTKRDILKTKELSQGKAKRTPKTQILEKVL